MAAGGAVKELCEEATCSICLDYFNDPVTIAECGHSFCRACLTRSWGEAAGGEPSCPQCRGTAREGNLRPNQQLANFVEIIKKLSPQGGKKAAVKGGEGREGVCEKHQEPLIFFCKEDEASLCVVCVRSKEHKHHDVIPLEEASQENKTLLEPGKGSICAKHQEPLKLFCKDDEALICLACDSTEHKYHNVIPPEEAAKEYKKEMGSILGTLKEERKNMVTYKADVMKDSQHLLKQTRLEKQKAVMKFRQLHKFLEEQEKLLLAHMEEVEKEVARKRDELLAKLSEEMSSFESIIQEMEKKCQQLDTELLQDIRSTLQRYEEEKLEEPVVLPLALKWVIWDFCDISAFLEGAIKQFEDTVVVGLQQQKAANVSLDPDTAHMWLIVSEDRKSVEHATRKQDLPPNPKRFQCRDFVLGWERFTAGRHFWEVNVITNGGDWGVGTARRSVSRNSWIDISPKEGIWSMKKDDYGYHALDFPSVGLSQCGELKRIRVSLNYAGGRVAFFDADRAALLYAFTGASFSGETLQPLFWVSKGAHLVISPC